MPIQIQGGPAINVVVDSSAGAQFEGGSAIPVAVVTDGRRVTGNKATRVVVVTNPDHIEGGPAIPVVAANAGDPVEGGPAMRVYVVQGSLGGLDIVRSGLVSEYRFNEGSGLTLTDYASGYNGALGTGGSDQPDWVTAGLNFVAANADVVVNTTMPDSALLGALTYCVVANIASGSAFRAFLSKSVGSGSAANPGEFRTDNSATPKLFSARANAAANTYSGPNAVVGAYRMYSMTLADGNVNTAPIFYVGTTPTTGTLSTGTATGAATGTSQNLRIGRRADGAVQMNGTIASVLVYNRALSAAEITRNYQALQASLATRGITLP